MNTLAAFKIVLGGSINYFIYLWLWGRRWCMSALPCGLRPHCLKKKKCCLEAKEAYSMHINFQANKSNKKEKSLLM